MTGQERRDPPLGTLAYGSGLVTAGHGEDALQDAVQRGRRLGQALVERGLVEEGDIARLLAEQHGLQFVSIRERPIEPEAIRLLSRDVAWMNHAVPVWFDAGEPVIAIEDPTDELMMVKVSEALGRRHRFVVVTGSDVMRLLAEWYPLNAAAPQPPASVTLGPEIPQAAPPLASEVPQVGAAANAGAPGDGDAPASVRIAEPVRPPIETTPGIAPVTPAQPVERETPAPAAEPAPAPPPAPVVRVSYRVVVRLIDGERIDAGTFPSDEEAKEHARALIQTLQSDGAEWPFLHDRFIRPQNVVSVDLTSAG